LNENNVAGDFGETAAERGAFALILCLKKDAEIAQLDGIGAIDGGGEGFAGALQLNEFFQDLASAVGGAIVDDDDFLPEFSFDDAAKDFVNSSFFVVNRNDDREFGIDQSKWVVT
jgi:hypothetical protein